MEIISLYYFQELAKELHVTNTANRLNITQQTLSNHIKRLEEHYGTLLFYRKPSLKLTYAGEQMLSFTRSIVNEERNIRNIMSDIEKNEMGAISFGASTARGMALLPEIIPKFNSRYPNVEIKFKDLLSKELEKSVENGDLDFAIILFERGHTSLVQQHIFRDQVYLCVPQSLMEKHYGYESKKILEISSKGAYVENFSRLPFSMYNNRLGSKIRTCFEMAHFEPNIHFTSSYSQLLVPFCAQGISACFITRMNLTVALDQFKGKVNIMPLYCNSLPLIQDISVIYHKQKYLPTYGKYFLKVIYDYFEKLDQTTL